MSTVQTEHVMVVPTELFREAGYFQGFSTDVERYLPTLLDPLNTSYRPRSEMETDPSFKQLIPYAIVRWQDEGVTKVFRYTRGKGQGESRLHAKSSIGIGGHISTLDENHQDPYAEGMRRELDEELILNTNYQETCVGILNDDSNEVGQVHLGVVHILDVESPDVQPREEDILEAGFEDVETLLADADRFESWSQICLKALFVPGSESSPTQ